MKGGLFFLDFLSSLSHNGSQGEKPVDRFPIFDIASTLNLLIGMVIGLVLTTVVRAFLGV
ncbi:MAG: hypothetical protein HY590_05975 [Candidatus Omnitrophica bacterium]|nr:hypothetical protein [Candidatus Omnitrophota bacterium]